METLNSQSLFTFELQSRLQAGDVHDLYFLKNPPMMPTRRQMVCDEELRLTNGKENSTGKNCLRTSEILCPESTSTAVAIVEQPELRYARLYEYCLSVHR